MASNQLKLSHGDSPAGPAPTGPLSAEDLRELVEARHRARKVRRAANVAAFSGWTMVFFAVMTLLGALFGDVVSLLVGCGLAAVAYNELRGGAMLRQLDPQGASRLGYNQIGLALLIVSYASWSLYSALNNPALSTATTGDANIDAMVTQLSRVLSWGVYGGIAIIGIVGPGFTSWYYFTRGNLVRGLLRQTPTWVIQAMRAAA